MFAMFIWNNTIGYIKGIRVVKMTSKDRSKSWTGWLVVTILHTGVLILMSILHRFLPGKLAPWKRVAVAEKDDMCWQRKGLSLLAYLITGVVILMPGPLTTFFWQTGENVGVSSYFSRTNNGAQQILQKLAKSSFQETGQSFKETAGVCFEGEVCAKTKVIRCS